MRRQTPKARARLAAAVALGLVMWATKPGAATALQSDQPGPERFRAVAANMGQLRGPMASAVDIDIKR